MSKYLCLKRPLLRTALATWLAAAILTAPAQAGCKLGKLLEMPVTTTNLVPLVNARIDGQDVQFIADSGAFWSMLSPASASRLNLKLKPLSMDFYVTGIGGSANVSLAVVKKFEFAGYSVPNVSFLVGGSDAQSDSVGLLGQNLFSIADVEFDLAGGVLRLIKPTDCKKAVLAYWAADGKFSVVEIEHTTPAQPHTVGTATLNGKTIKVMFDTGSPTSALSLRAAERAGVKPDSPGVVDGGESSGVGRKRTRSYVGPFDSFTLGQEEIHHTRLRFMDLAGADYDMLIGADFFLSHHVYVASSQHLLYFTYNGGPVFNLAQRPSSADSHEPAALPATPSADSTDKPAQQWAERTDDAASDARRGIALASRHDFEHALAELNKACELSPGESDYFYHRAEVYFALKNVELASKDLDRSIELRSDHALARMARAQLRSVNRQRVDAIADLDVVDKSLAKEDDLRFSLAGAYERNGELDAAATNFSTWLSFHAEDSRRSMALRQRCEIHALQGSQLPQALADCDKAIDLMSKVNDSYAPALTDRGLVRLRMRDYVRSIKDFDAALLVQPNYAWALYGRGLAEVHKSSTAASEADLAKAVELNPDIADTFKHYGIEP